MEEIYAASGRGLGDRWASVSFCIREALSLGRRVKMSLRYFKASKNVWRHYDLDMLPLFENSDCVEIVSEAPTRQLTWQEIFHRTPYQRSMKQWSANSSGLVCYQFDGRSARGKNLKGPDEERFVLEEIRRLGWKPVKLGKEIGDRPLELYIEHLSRCEFFIGVDSGLSHVAHSVGTPIVMLLNGRGRRLWESQGERRLLLANDHFDAAAKIAGLRNNGHAYYEENSTYLDCDAS